MKIVRCDWVLDNELSKKYHDEEWGNLDRFDDDHYLFEMLTLEGAQAGLSWQTILNRREYYREAFDQFNPEIVARYDDHKKRELLKNEGIIRNQKKIESTIKNAQAFLQIQEEYGSFHHFLWDFMDGKIIINEWKSSKEIPAKTELSEKLSKLLKKHNFSFVGPVICYSFLQAVGLVNDHTIYCFKHPHNK